MKSGRIALLLLIVLCVASMPWLVHPYFNPHWDATIYVLTARSIVAGDGYAIFGEPFHLRPPGFSLILAPLIAIPGFDVAHLNQFVTGWGIVALALTFLYFRPRLGTPITLAFCLSLWLNPQFQLICNAVLSDTIGLAFLVGCLLVDRWVQAKPTAWRYAVLGIGLGLSLYLRSVCMLLIPAIVASRFLRRGTESGQPLLKRIGRLSLLLIVPFLLQQPWSLWKKNNPAPQPSDEVGLHSYWTAQWHELVWDPESPLKSFSDHKSRVAVRLDQCTRGLGSRLPVIHLPMLLPDQAAEVRDSTFGPASTWLGVGVIAALLYVAARRRDPGNLFALGNLAVLMIYFDYDERILVPSYLFVGAAVLELMRQVLGRWLQPKLAVGLVVLFVVAITANDMRGLRRGEHLAEPDLRYKQVARYLQRRHPDAVVAASLGHVFATYLQRPVHFLELAGRREQRAGIERALREHEVDLLVHTGRHNRYLDWYLVPLLQDYGTLIHRNDRVRVYWIRKKALGR